MTTSLILVAELIRSISNDTHQQLNDRRRACTRMLNQLKKEKLPNLTKEESLELLLGVNVDDGGSKTICNDISSSSPSHCVVKTLLSIINNDDNFSTEGHRECSVDILRELCILAFDGGGGGDDDDGDNQLQIILQQDDNGMLLQTANLLSNLFQQCSQTFTMRMSRYQSSHNNNNKLFSHGTATEPMESSEHIRLLLVELMIDLGGYCLTSSATNEHDGSCDEANQQSKVIIDATSNICQTLAKSTFLDPYPEVQRAACNLIEVLAQLCPLAVRMNASSLLVPLTGKVVDGSSVNNQQRQSNATANLLSKKCLFRHRHGKTRCKAVEASAAIVTCCPRGGVSVGNHSAGGQDTSNSDDTIQAPDYLSNYGSHSTSMERILNDTLLPSWDELLKMDSLPSVQTTVLKSLGKVSSILGWGAVNDVANNNDDSDASSDMDLEFMVEAKVLTLLLSCMHAGGVEQVRKMAVRQLSSVQRGLAAYFPQMVEHILASCSESWMPCQSRVRSLEALQVLLSIACPLMDGDIASLSASDAAKVKSLSTLVGPIVETLTKNILSEENDVLGAALTCCRILGANNQGSKVALEEIFSIQSCTTCEGSNALVANDSDSEEDDTTAATTASSLRQMTSILLCLDGMMKGSLGANDAKTILEGIDPELAIPTPHWFRSVSVVTKTISSLLCHSTIINNVSRNSSLAWALLDACHSFVQCAGQKCEDNLELSDDVIIDVLISITYLLSCPTDYGVSSSAMSILGTFSSFGISTTSGSNDDDTKTSLMDVHFRRVLQKIVSSAPSYPWIGSDPAFLAMDALLSTCRGSTIGSNFDLVAPFFIGHFTLDCKEMNSSGGGDLTSATRDDLDEEYSLQISLMTLLQTILSDESFFCTHFTITALMSVVLPSLVWKAGAMASTLRKVAVAALHAFLKHCNDTDATIRPGMISQLIPLLHSNLEDYESTTRELSCACLSMVLEHISVETFCAIWQTNYRVIDTICPQLLELLDDSHDPVRIAACMALEKYLALAHGASISSSSSFDLDLSSVENVTTSLLIQLDDPDKEVQDSVFQVLSELLQLHSNEEYVIDIKVVDMMKKHIKVSLASHRDASYSQILLAKIEQ